MLRITAAAILLATSSVAFAADTEPADPAKAQQYVETVCIACHGMDGNGLDPANPITMYPMISGQNAEYILKQLNEFYVDVSADPPKPALREEPNMNAMLAAVPPSEFKHLAAYFAQQKIAHSKVTADEETLALGKKLWKFGDMKKGIPACTGCHGPNGHGMPAQYPALAGQYPEYLELQLNNFRQGLRTNDPSQMMRMTAEKMSDKEIKAVSQYAASLR